MELYFKDLISTEASLEQLVDDLSLVVQGADDYVKVVSANVSDHTLTEVTGRLNRLKQNSLRLKNKVMVGAKNTDKLVRANPYSVVAIAFTLGLFVGAQILRKK